MTLELGKPDEGCLLFGDITGYTQYLKGTELMHAQDVLGDLLETLVASIEPVFKLSKLEGDAVLAYGSVDSLTPTMVMDTVESAYFAFRRRLRDVIHSTTCDCNACSLIPSLDLKFFVHAGEYVRQSIAGNEELTGPDVVLIHRLAKGTSGEAIGKPAYTVYTASTMEALAMNPEILGFVAHTEHFDDVGDIEVFVQDLAIRWAFEQERKREYVTSADAVWEHSFSTSAPPATVWEYLTDPRKRVLWQPGVDEVTTVTEGRYGAGSINHCAHGPDIIVEHIADWRPFSYLSMRYVPEFAPDGWLWTIQLHPLENGTKVSLRLSDPGQERWEMIGNDTMEMLTSEDESLKAVLDQAMATTTA